MSIKKSGRIANGVTKSAKNLTPEAGDTIKSIVDVLVDILVVITNKKKIMVQNSTELCTL